jgi:hypothetical protein
MYRLDQVDLDFHIVVNASDRRPPIANHWQSDSDLGIRKRGYSISFVIPPFTDTVNKRTVSPGPDS